MIKKWMIWVFGIVIGATGGYLYWYYVGCASGSCAITSSPVNSTLYGAVMGGLLVNTFNYKRKETEDKKEFK
jgi:phage shock protein E